MDITEARAVCQRFATEHRMIFDQGECGIGRPCVGFRDGNHWIDYTPYDASKDYAPVPGFTGEAIRPPDYLVPDAYHKHDCLTVLVHGGNYDYATIQLAEWVRHMEAQGPLEVVEYETGATGFQALLTGVVARAIRVCSTSPRGA